MREHTLPCSHHHSVLPLSCPLSNVRSGRPGHGGITKRLSSYHVFRHCNGFHHPSQNDILPRVRRSACMSPDPPTDNRLPTDSPNGGKCRISPHFRPSSGSRPSMRCLPSDPRYSRLFVMRTRRPSKASALPSHSERASSVDGLLTRMRSSTSSSSRTSHPHYRWHTTWQLEKVLIR